MYIAKINYNIGFSNKVGTFTSDSYAGLKKQIEYIREGIKGFGNIVSIRYEYPSVKIFIERT